MHLAQDVRTCMHAGMRAQQVPNKEPVPLQSNVLSSSNLSFRAGKVPCMMG